MWEGCRDLYSMQRYKTVPLKLVGFATTHKCISRKTFSGAIQGVRYLMAFIKCIFVRGESDTPNVTRGKTGFRVSPDRNAEALVNFLRPAVAFFPIRTQRHRSAGILRTLFFL